MGAVGADGELQLEKELVGLDALAIGGVAVLAADLTELARPVGEDGGSALVLERSVETEGPRLRAGGEVAAAPDELGAREQAAIDRPPQGPPTQGHVGPDQRRMQSGPFLGRAAGEGPAEIEVGR